MKKKLLKLLLPLVALVVVLGLLSGFIIDIQWFEEVGYLGVYLTSLKSQAIIFVPSLILIFLLVYAYSSYLKRAYIKNNNQVFDKIQIKNQNKIVFAISSISSI